MASGVIVFPGILVAHVVLILMTVRETPVMVMACAT